MRTMNHGGVAVLAVLAASAALFGLGGHLAGCGGGDATDAGTLADAPHSGGGACTTNFDCPNGNSCQGGQCVPSQAGNDAGVVDDAAQGDTGGGTDDTGTADDAGSADDTGTTSDAGPAAAVTVYQVQNAAAAGHPAVDSAVTVTGVVATTPVAVISAKSGLNGFFAQEKAGGEWSGIMITGKAPVFPASVTPGDVFTVTGTYQEFKGATDTYSNSEIDVTAIEKTGTDAVPAPAVIATPADIATGGSLAENYQGVLVRVTNVTVTAAADGFGQWKVSGDLMVDKLFYAFTPAAGTSVIELTGVLNTSYNDYKLEPRSAEDVKTEGTDAGQPDVGTGDAGQPDAGTVDAGTPDGGCTPDCAGAACGADDTCGGKCIGTCANAGDVCNPSTFACEAKSCTGIATHLVISQLQVKGAVAADEFVELYNPTATDVAINGWRLRYKSDTGATWNNFSGGALPAGTVVKAHGFYLMTAVGYTGGVTGDRTYADTLSGTAGHVQLIDGTSAAIDTVGYGTTANTAEGGHPVTVPPASKSIVRKSYSTGVVAGKGGGYDTNDNANDFAAPGTPAPRNASSPVEDHGCP